MHLFKAVEYLVDFVFAFVIMAFYTLLEFFKLSTHYSEFIELNLFKSYSQKVDSWRSTCFTSSQNVYFSFLAFSFYLEQTLIVYRCLLGMMLYGYTV